MIMRSVENFEHMTFEKLNFMVKLFSRKSAIAQVVEEFNSKTCLKLRPKTDSDTNYVHVFPGNGCYSSVGKVGQSK